MRDAALQGRCMELYDIGVDINFAPAMPARVTLIGYTLG
jgi:hypothetical protein